MNKIIKTLTLLFFISGISLFVSYSSGCFTTKKESESLPRFGGSKAAILPDLLEESEAHKRELDSLELLAVDEAVIQSEMDSLEKARLIRMLGSKSGVMNEQTDYTAVNKRIKLLENILKQRQ